MMKKSLLVFILCIVAGSVFALPVYGDVKPGVSVNTLTELKELTDKTVCDQVLICGDNLTAVEISPNMLNYLKWIDQDSQVSLSSDILPPVCSIKNIRFIALNCKESAYSLSVIDSLYQDDIIKAYDFIISRSKMIGQSEKNGYSAKKYQIPDSFKTDFVKEGKKYLFITNTGTERIGCPDMKINFDMTHFMCDKDTVLAVWSDYPETGLRDIFFKQKESMDNQKTLSIFIDGLGWHLLENYCAINHLNISETGFNPTRSVFPSRTQYAYFMLGTGSYLNHKTENKIFSEKVFSNGLIIEEEKCYYPSTARILLNTDENDNGTKDDEIFVQAKKAIKKNQNDFLLVHFHSVDDMAHDYGPYHTETMKQLQTILDYTSHLIRLFKGQVIIYSDHGGHSLLNNGGTHGSTRAEDMTGVIKNVKKN